MSLGRYSDQCDTHPKLLALGTGQRGDARRWTWFRLTQYAHRAEDSLVPQHISETIPAATPRFIQDCVQIGLLDQRDDGTTHLHNYVIYSNESTTHKVQHYLTHHPDTTANQLQKIIGGKRQAILDAHARFQRITPEPPPPSSPEPPQPVPLVRAYGTSPSKEQEPPPKPSPTTSPPNGEAKGASKKDLEPIANTLAAQLEVLASGGSLPDPFADVGPAEWDV